MNFKEKIDKETEEVFNACEEFIKSENANIYAVTCLPFSIRFAIAYKYAKELGIDVNELL